MNRVEHIRKEEKNYHDHCYDQYELFKEGSWLHKPVKAVLDLIPFIQKIDQPKVLDLGSGVGRNSIPIAQAIKDNGGQVVCVDLLDSALEKLIDYSETYQVRDVIESVKADIGDYQIKPNEFDFIIAVSSLEHVVTEEKFERVIQQMAAGTKVNGINGLVVNSEVEEIDLDTNESLNALMEVNLSTEKLLNKLRAIYRNWDILQTEVKRLEYTINRGEKPVLLKTKAVTFVVKKSGRSDN
ncbi:class I SAM-dependent methyltransferase [Bacillus niameyensis]|uniref:class I SAM-dependent methyltransferase n=1 Tax=Bacillus niameyensis TaxID=1522308 RepID=UPI000785242E|nr:class I SAM-dependent methyltransferase [Bacillus niameyensis]